jgi:hypothetical protein
MFITETGCVFCERNVKFEYNSIYFSFRSVNSLAAKVQTRSHTRPFDSLAENIERPSMGASLGEGSFSCYWSAGVLIVKNIFCSFS